VVRLRRRTGAGRLPDWDDIADAQMASLHAEARDPADDARTLADRLASAAGTEFTRRWDLQPAGGRRTGVMALAHPEVGALRLAFETLDLADPDRQRLVVYLAADEASSVGLDRLAGRQPGRLRSVAAG